MKAFRVGLIVGCGVCIVLWPIMYAASLNPRAAWSAPVASASLVLWPSSLMLMAIQRPGLTLYSAQVLGIAVLANGLLYGLISGVGYLAIRGARGEL